MMGDDVHYRRSDRILARGIGLRGDSTKFEWALHDYLKPSRILVELAQRFLIYAASCREQVDSRVRSGEVLERCSIV